MFQLPNAAIGAVVAALIAGVVSLLGLIISKEQKTSEFRQAWIDALRADLSAFLTQINAIQDATKVKYKFHYEKVKVLSPLYITLNNSTFNIILRVNREEAKSARLLTAMEGFNDLTSDEARLTPSNIRPVEAEFLTASQELLKFEWGRVKSGELAFKIAKIAAILVIVASASVFIAVAIDRIRSGYPAVSQATRSDLKSPSPATVPDHLALTSRLATLQTTKEGVKTAATKPQFTPPINPAAAAPNSEN